MVFFKFKESAARKGLNFGCLGKSEKVETSQDIFCGKTRRSWFFLKTCCDDDVRRGSFRNHWQLASDRRTRFLANLGLMILSKRSSKSEYLYEPAVLTVSYWTTGSSHSWPCQRLDQVVCVVVVVVGIIWQNLFHKSQPLMAISI